ncbi:MAG: hypothetical protein KatS3mg110_0403 [Pirellulaceae bacterium]|nr:MAG: hypothetical protein KatS3mg110_0403 [Pirellulaceae bacterium]
MFLWASVPALLIQLSAAIGQETNKFVVPEGVVVEQVAGPPLVRYPLFGCFDDQGRLYVAEGTGLNAPGTELVQHKLGRITLLEDTDGDGRFDKSTCFADQLVFPQGVLWHNGVVYTASHPYIWRLQDTDGDGRADRRDALVGKFGFNGNGCDIHGPFLGPDGRLYWTDGRHGYDIQCPDGTRLEGLAARIFRSRLDGTEIERIAGGGFDNPVELVFTLEGELIGTMDQGPGDRLLHYVEGGVYPRMDHPCVAELVQTGPPLGSVAEFSAALPVALCGLERVRSDHFGPEMKGSLLTAQFNVHRIQQHLLERVGATFRSVDRDWLVSFDHDVRLTDVLEDADGSLLVIDMGAWFNYGCPTAKIARPEVLGAIYRVRRRDAPVVDDPWGERIPWKTLSTSELAQLLDDPRPKVQDKAIAKLASQGPTAVAALQAAAGRGSVQGRANAVWALCRIDHPSARAAVRSALASDQVSVRHVALHAVSLWRDAEALPELLRMVQHEPPALRLKAAEALGRIGDARAVPVLFDCLRRGTEDRFLEHALIYALIRVDNRDATLRLLSDPNPHVRRAALIALDQMPNGRLTRDLVFPLLDTDDPDLQETAMLVISRHEGWGQGIAELAGRWLESPQLSEHQQRSLTGILIAFGGDPQVQRLVAQTLSAGETPLATRALLLEVMARSTVRDFPKEWLDALRTTLVRAGDQLAQEAVATIRSRNLRGLEPALVALSRDGKRPRALRVSALECVTAHMETLPEDLFELLLSAARDDIDPLAQAAAARALAQARLDEHQLVQVTQCIAESGPVVVPLLIRPFERSRSAQVGLALVEALKRSPGAEAVSADELQRLLDQFPDQVRDAARPVAEKILARHQQQAAYLARIKWQLLRVKGDPQRGREVFFSRKAACAGCHRLGDRGGHVGPELTYIGRLRSPADLVEAVIFPSSTIVMGYEPYSVATVEGKVYSGLIVRETSEAVFLRTNDLAEIRIPRGQIEAIRRSEKSVMPDGLENSLSSQELADLLEFLYSCR